jgi:hypothetical protein
VAQPQVLLLASRERARRKETTRFGTTCGGVEHKRERSPLVENRRPAERVCCSVRGCSGAVIRY